MSLQKTLNKIVKDNAKHFEFEYDSEEQMTFEQNKLLPFKEHQKLVSKYMNFMDYIKMEVAFGKYMPKYQRDIYTATDILNKIVSYKVKMAVKNGKTLKNDPRKKAFIDISDCLSRYNTDDCKFHIKTVGFGSNKDGMGIEFKHTGKIVLPFKNCFVYTQFDKVFGQVMEITDNEDGTYSGTFWLISRLEKIIQMSFHIRRVDYDWHVKLIMKYHQKPLGQVFSNIGVIFNHLSVAEKDDYDIDGLKSRLENYGDYVGALFSMYSSGILLMLSYLSSYKSKVVYKLDNKYVYSDKIGEDIENYMSENYPDITPERIKGWLAGGNWDFLNPNDFGVDKNGKKIKGMTWNDPYKNHKNEQIVESNEETTRLIPIHALERVKERYNIDLSQEDLQEIANECLKGHATKLTVRDKFGKLNTAKGRKSCYRVKYKKNIFDVVLSDSMDKNSYRIATFLPKPKEINYTVIDTKDYNEVMKDVENV